MIKIDGVDYFYLTALHTTSEMTNLQHNTEMYLYHIYCKTGTDYMWQNTLECTVLLYNNYSETVPKLLKDRYYYDVF